MPLFVIMFIQCSKKLGAFINLIVNNHVFANMCSENDRKEKKNENYNLYKVRNMQIFSGM